MDYVGYTNRHLHQRVAEPSSLNSSIGKHMYDLHGILKPNLTIEKNAATSLSA